EFLARNVGCRLVGGREAVRHIQLVKRGVAGIRQPRVVGRFPRAGRAPGPENAELDGHCRVVLAERGRPEARRGRIRAVNQVLFLLPSRCAVTGAFVADVGGMYGDVAGPAAAEEYGHLAAGAAVRVTAHEVTDNAS